jgi:hypothetical protein
MQYTGELALPESSAHRDSRKRKLPQPDSIGERSTKLATVIKSTIKVYYIPLQQAAAITRAGAPPSCA